MSSDATSGIFAFESDYLDRYVQIGIASNRLISVSFPTSAPEEFDSTHPILDRIESYLDGANEDFSDIDIALTVQSDHRSVLETVRNIPYGEQRQVVDVATITPGLDKEAESDLATVRSALAENPTPLLIPDHRIPDGPSAAPPPVEQRLRSLEKL